MHVDLQRVVENEKIRIHLPIHFKGESISPGVKTQGGVVSHMRADVEVSCLPKDLPEFLELDLSGMNLNETKFLSDIPLPPGVDDPGADAHATRRWSRSTRRVPRSRSRGRRGRRCRRAPCGAAAAAVPAPRRRCGSRGGAQAGDAKKGDDKKAAAPAKKEGGKK